MSAPEADRAADFTVDAFHRGDFLLVQPARKGHRAGTDAMMLAASVPSGFSGRLADFGAGAGAAGLAVASRCPAAHVTLIERSAEMADYARRSIGHEANRRLAGRCEVVEADVRMSDAQRCSMFGDFSFDWAIMNPPFNSALDRPSPDALRRQAHVMEDAHVFNDWLKTAGWLVKPRGGVAVIARPQSLLEILSAMRPYFGAAEIRALHPRADRPATRIVVRGREGVARDVSLMPPLVLHEPGSHRFSPEADAINNGRASLFGD